MLESYFYRQNQADLLLSRDTVVLEDRLRMKIVNCLVDFMVEAFGIGDPSKITKQQKHNTASAAVSLFIGLKSHENSNELVRKLLILKLMVILGRLSYYGSLSFQFKLTGANGFLHIRLKYLKSKYDELNRVDSDEISTQLAETQISPENDLEFLKTCVVKNADRNAIIIKLKSTQKLRERMMRDENVDLRESFPFFFADPSLVLFLIFERKTFYINKWLFYFNFIRLCWISAVIQVHRVLQMPLLMIGRSIVQN